jgi:hypothetical protein
MIDTPYCIHQNPIAHASSQISLIKTYFFNKHIPEIPLLFIINSETSRLLYASRHNKEGNILKHAYVKWFENGLKNTGPEIYLSTNVQKELTLITHTYPIALNEGIELIKRLKNFSKPINYIKKIPQ